MTFYYVVHIILYILFSKKSIINEGKNVIIMKNNTVPGRFSLEKKVAIVTGGAGLYGRQIVRALAEAGAKVYVASRNMDTLEEFTASERKNGNEVHSAFLDLADEKSILNMTDTIFRKEGHIDILINNAVSRTMKNGFKSSSSEFDESMHINGTGLFVITRSTGDHMAEQKKGSIINIGSIRGSTAPQASLYRDTDMNCWQPDYNYNKGGMISFTQFTASYYGRYGVRCNCISPGGFYTENTPRQFLERYNERTCLGRMGNDSDIQGAVIFLASEASSYITGINMNVDGGYTAF